MAARSHQHSDSGGKKQAPRGRRARAEGKLLVTSRKRQKRQQLVQTVIVGFTMVVKPVESTIVHGDSELVQLGDDAAAVEMLRGRGRPRQPVPMPELLQVPTAGYIVDRARRRVRNRSGRFELQHEVQYGVRPGGPSSRRWLSATEFEELLDAHKIEGDLGTADGV
ncbi:hypothetical protein PF004_g25549 [Phytophthora fragariae]|uniref:Uncharacterized protein n=2 Tax=Phytophthora fragariae TaxID=53985 RepID=A0A6G0MRY8_9STRA|nr:hypothetical protein PF004_g25549 [Phytophthora fragariae]